MDQKIGRYTTKGLSRKWPLVTLVYILDTARVNTTRMSAIAAGSDPRTVDSFKTGWKLAMELVLPLFIENRSKNGLTSKVFAKNRHNAW